MADPVVDPQPTPTPAPGTGDGAQPTPTPGAGGPSGDDLAAPEQVSAWKKRIAEAKKRIAEAKQAAADRQQEIERLSAENQALQTRVESGTLTAKQQAERAAAANAAKDDLLKSATAKDTIDRITRERIAQVIGAGEQTVDEDKVAELIGEVVTVSPTEVALDIGGNGQLEIFVRSEAVARLEKSIGRIVELAATTVVPGGAPPPARPGVTPPRKPGGSGKPSAWGNTWDADNQSSALGKANAKIAAAAAQAGRDGVLAQTDTAL